LKALVIGYGSIGRRHIDNLSQIPYVKIIVQTNRKSNSFLKNKKCELIKNITEGIKQKPDFAIITNETNLHLKTATTLAQNNIPFLVEKPLSNNYKGIENLLKIIREKKLITLMGCPLRFHPSIKKIKEIVEKKKIGKIYYVFSENGSYLPHWHPKEDYRKSYSANIKLGGGVLLTNIHEIDYLYWLFGKIQKTFSTSGKISNLDLDVEDYASVNLFYKNFMAFVHLDFFQIPKRRQLRIIGENGIIDCDLIKNRLTFYDSNNEKINKLISNSNFDFNTIYVDELNHFISCVRNQKTTINPVTVGAEVLKTVLLIKKSAKEKRMIKYNDL